MDKNPFSPFLRLYKYRPTNKHTPRENFMTESLAMCLFYNTHIAQAFLEKFLGLSTDTISKIDTQVRKDRYIFDLTIEYDLSYFVLIECKFGAPIGEGFGSEANQIDDYIGFLKNHQSNRKFLLLITLADNSIGKDENEIIFKAWRWNDIREFLQSQKGNTEIGELFRSSLIDLLNHLKVDRQPKDGRLQWKCDLCEQQTSGFGIQSHKRKHERENFYQDKINRINELRLRSFNAEIEPYLNVIDEIEKQLIDLPKIEKSNFNERNKVIYALEQKLPEKFWISFVEGIGYHFSHKAYADFIAELQETLKRENIESLVKPSLLSCSYENIVEYLNDD